jgi:uncharacterized protein (DUF2225 family)
LFSRAVRTSSWIASIVVCKKDFWAITQDFNKIYQMNNYKEKEIKASHSGTQHQLLLAMQSQHSASSL